MSHNQPIVWFHKRLKKSNQHCPYCARYVGEGSPLSSDRKHLIARNSLHFGSFLSGSEFNFIFRACKDCNNKKSLLEKSISTVSVLGSLSNSGADLTPEQSDRALHKARADYHPERLGVKVIDAYNSVSLKGQGLSVTLNSNPDVNDSWYRKLSHYYIKAFFYLVTSADPTKVDGTVLLPEKNIKYYGNAKYLDWGRDDLKEVEQRALRLQSIVKVNTALGNFRCFIAKEGSPSGEWFWLFEWNQYVRVYGSICHESVMPRIFQSLPELTWSNWFKEADGSMVRFREEIPSAIDIFDYLT